MKNDTVLILINAPALINAPSPFPKLLSTSMGVDYVVIGFDMEVQCSLIFLCERYLHRCREQSFAIRVYAMSAVGIGVVSCHTKYCRIAYGTTR